MLADDGDKAEQLVQFVLTSMRVGVDVLSWHLADNAIRCGVSALEEVSADSLRDSVP